MTCGRTVEHDVVRAPRPTESAGAVSGSITGAMTLDRQRGWIISALTDMTVRSTVTTANAPAVPLRVTVRVIQKMRANDQD